MTSNLILPLTGKVLSKKKRISGAFNPNYPLLGRIQVLFSCIIVLHYTILNTNFTIQFLFLLTQCVHVRLANDVIETNSLHFLYFFSTFQTPSLTYSLHLLSYLLTYSSQSNQAI